MPIFDFLRGEFIDVIHWTDDRRDRLVWRFDRAGHAIRYGAKLTVRAGQAAVFVHEGQVADVFAPGLYRLETNTMPVLTRLKHWDHGFRSPFTSEIYFVNTTRFRDLKWGTRSPVILRDPEFGPLRLRAYGTYAIRVIDPARFLTEIVGTDGEFTTDEISDQIRNIILQQFGPALSGAGLGAFDIAASTGDLGRRVAADIAPVLAEYGLEIPELYVEKISLPAAVEATLDARAASGLGRAGADKTPPPPPAAQEWHIAEGGQSYGPYSRETLARMARDGRIGSGTLAWTAGQQGWKPAGEIAELAALFGPPPPPRD